MRGKLYLQPVHIYQYYVPLSICRRVTKREMTFKLVNTVYKKTTTYYGGLY